MGKERKALRNLPVQLHDRHRPPHFIKFSGNVRPTVPYSRSSCRIDAVNDIQQVLEGVGLVLVRHDDTHFLLNPGHDDAVNATADALDHALFISPCDGTDNVLDIVLRCSTQPVAIA